MGIVSTMTVDNETHLIASTAYGICSTAASTAQKSVSLYDFDTYTAGMTIHVKFKNGNTASNPTLNVNSRGAKPIYTRGTSVLESWEPGSVFSFTYDVSDSSTGCWIINDFVGDSYSSETYENLPADQGGTAVSLVTTGDKYIWNNKQNKVTYSTTDLVDGQSPLTTGELYVVYENSGGGETYYTVSGTVMTNSSVSSTGGSISGTGSYLAGSSVTLQATSNSGYVFEGWKSSTSSSSYISTSSSYTINNLSSNTTLVAVFVIDDTPSYNWVTATFSAVTRNAAGTSSTVSTTGGTVVPVSQTVNSGNSASSVASANSGYQFKGWTTSTSSTSYLTTSSTLTRTITSNTTYYAIFQKDEDEQMTQYTVSGQAMVNGQGYVSGAGTITGYGTYDSGSTVSLLATPNSGYSFTGWMSSSSSVLLDAHNPYQFTITSNRTIDAVFTQSSSGTYSLTIISVTDGSVSSTGGTAGPSGSYSAGSSVTLHATPSAGYKFKFWGTSVNGGSISTSNDYQITINSNRTIYAMFEALPSTSHTVTVSPDTDGILTTTGGTVTGSGTYNDGDTVSLIATVNSGYHFVSWDSSTLGVASAITNRTSTSASLTLTSSMSNNIVIFGKFESDTPTVTATFSAVLRSYDGLQNAISTAGGSVSKSSQSVSSGGTVTCTASANSGHTFQGWGTAINSTSYVSTSTTLSKQIDSSTNFYAIFKENSSSGTTTTETISSISFASEENGTKSATLSNTPKAGTVISVGLRVGGSMAAGPSFTAGTANSVSNSSVVGDFTTSYNGNKTITVTRTNATTYQFGVAQVTYTY